MGVNYLYTQKYNTCEISRVCNNRCLLLKRKRDHAWLCLTYFDFEFGDGFNRNFFDRDRRFYSKNWIFRIIEIRKIGNIFTLNNSENDRDWQSDSKNPVVSKNRRSNHGGLTVWWNRGFVFAFIQILDFAILYVYSEQLPATPEQRLPSIRTKADRLRSPPQVLGLQDLRLGFQVDRVKYAEQGEGKVRLTAYYASTGKVCAH